MQSAHFQPKLCPADKFADTSFWREGRKKAAGKKAEKCICSVFEASLPSTTDGTLCYGLEPSAVRCVAHAQKIALGA